MYATLVSALPSNLRTRLNIITQEIPGFWEQGPYRHFTNHGPAHSERVAQKLAQLIYELPEAHRLTNDGVFIVFASAWLYEIGMQSPNPGSTIIDFDYRPGRYAPKKLDSVVL